MKRRLSRRRRRRLAVQERLVNRDLDGLRQMWARDTNLLSGLVALLNEPDDLLRWRAIEALGTLTGELARRDIDTARDLVRRQLWTMTEESGNQSWHAAEAIGEMLYHTPELAEEFAVVVAHHEEEPMFRPGALWSMGRLAERCASLLRPEARLALPHLEDPDPICRGHAAWALGRLGHGEARAGLEGLVDDGAEVRLYDFDSGELVSTTVGQLARDALGQLDITT